MSGPDLSKLQIEREVKSFGPKRRPRWMKWAIGGAIVAALGVLGAYRSATAQA